MQARSAVAGDADAVPVAALIDEMIEELTDWRCVGETYTDQVKLTVANGAALEDPVGPFNASLEGNTRRAIDLYEGDGIDAEVFASLIREAVAANTSRVRSKPGSIRTIGDMPAGSRVDPAPFDVGAEVFQGRGRDARHLCEVIPPSE